MLITATALLVIVLVGAGAHSSASQFQRSADLVVTHVSTDIAGVLAIRPAVHPLQTPTWSGPGSDTDSAATFSAAVLASLLLGLLARVSPDPSSLAAGTSPSAVAWAAAGRLRN